MNTFQCTTSFKHWTKHMATMESAAHEVTFNMISHGRLKGDLPSTSVVTLLCAGWRSSLWKPLRLPEPAQTAAVCSGMCPSPLRAGHRQNKSLEAEQVCWEWFLFPSHRAAVGAVPRVSCLTAGSPHGLPCSAWTFQLHRPARLLSLKGEKAPHPSLTRRHLIHFFTTGKAFAVSRRECRKSNEIQKGAKWCFPLLDASAGSACCWHCPWWVKGDSFVVCH